MNEIIRIFYWKFNLRDILLESTEIILQITRRDAGNASNVCTKRHQLHYAVCVCLLFCVENAFSTSSHVWVLPRKFVSKTKHRL